MRLLSDVLLALTADSADTSDVLSLFEVLSSNFKSFNDANLEDADMQAESHHKLCQVINVSTTERTDVLLLTVLQRLPDSLKQFLGTHVFYTIDQDCIVTAPIGAQIGYAISGGYNTTSRTTPIEPPKGALISFLHLAAASGRPALTEFLLSECGADPNLAVQLLPAENEKPLTTIGGWTPLHIACGAEAVERSPVISKLIIFGANLCARDNFNWTCAAHALLTNSLVNLVLTVGAAPSGPPVADFLLNCDGSRDINCLTRVSGRLGEGCILALAEYWTNLYQSDYEYFCKLEPIKIDIITPSHPIDMVGLPFFTPDGAEEACEQPADTMDRCKVESNKKLTYTQLIVNCLKSPKSTFMDEEEPKQFMLIIMVILSLYTLQFSVPSELRHLIRAIYRSNRVISWIQNLQFINGLCFWITLGATIHLTFVTPRRRLQKRKGPVSRYRADKSGLDRFYFMLTNRELQESLAIREMPIPPKSSRAELIDARKKALAEIDPQAKLCFRCFAWKDNQRTYHCNRCGVCTPGLDHHCDFFYGCIGYEGHRSFVIMTSCGALLQIVYVLTCVLLLALQLWYRVFAFHLATLITAVLHGISLPWLATLAGGQWVNILENILVFEQIKGNNLPNFWRRVPNDRGKFDWQWRNPYNLGSPVENLIVFWTNPSERLDCDMERVISQDRKYVESLVENGGLELKRKSTVLSRLGKLFVPFYKPPGHIKTE